MTCRVQTQAREWATVCTGEFAAMSPGHAPWRSAEYRLSSEGRFARIAEAAGLAIVGTRALQGLWSARSRDPHRFSPGTAPGRGGDAAPDADPA